MIALFSADVFFVTVLIRTGACAIGQDRSAAAGSPPRSWSRGNRVVPSRGPRTQSRGQDGVGVVSVDSDFARFPTWINPLTT